MSEYRQGYYSVIQYIPDHGRLEAVNIGLTIFDVRQNRCATKVITEFGRVEQFFGKEAVKMVSMFVGGLVSRIDDHIHSLPELKNYVHTRANSIRLVEPRSMALERSLSDELSDLFSELVL